MKWGQAMVESTEATNGIQVERMMQRPLLYNNIDGVGEFGMGFMLLGFALLSWLQANSPRNAIWHRMDVCVVWVGLMLLGIHYGSKALKTHITYPRTGFVEYRKQKIKGWLACMLGCITSVATWDLIHFFRMHRALDRSHLGLTTPSALIGFVFVAAYAYGIARSVRWKWAVAATMAICSVVLAMLPAGVIRVMVSSTSVVATDPEWVGGAYLLSMMLYGAILIASGGISFVLYLRHTQPAVETAE